MRVFIILACAFALESLEHKHHHHHHHHHLTAKAEVKKDDVANTTASTEAEIVDKMKDLEAKMDTAEAAPADAAAKKQGRIVVNGPLPADFNHVFAEAVAAATGCDANAVTVIETHSVVVSFVQIAAKVGAGEVEVVFEAPAAVVDEVEAQAADAESKLVNGQLHDFLVASDDAEEPAAAAAPAAAAGAPEIDTEMPYGELEPFGREDTATELTDQSIKESDEMVDQLERAEVAEEKRSVFRAITRLRGAAITSFDGIARSQTGNIDEYAHTHQWRNTHPLHHLADEESDVSKWAFPDNAD